MAGTDNRLPWTPDVDADEAARADESGRSDVDLLSAYLSLEELARVRAVERALAERESSRLEVLDVVLASSAGLLGYVSQHLLQETLYETMKSSADWLDGWKGGSHPMDQAMRHFPKGSRGFHRLVFHDAFSIAENPFIVNIFGNSALGVPGMDGSVPAIIAKTFVHLLADVLTKRGLPLPGLGNLPQAMRVDIWKNHTAIYRDLGEFNVGDVAGLAAVKFATDGICWARGIPRTAVARHELKFISYTTYAVISALMSNPNPLAFGMAAWSGINAIRGSLEVTRLLNERADFVLVAANRLSTETERTLLRSRWVASLQGSPVALDEDLRMYAQEAERSALKARMRPVWNR